VRLPAAEAFANREGLGAEGAVDGREALVGRPALMAERGLRPPAALAAAARAAGMPLAGELARNLPLDVNLRGRSSADRLDEYFRAQRTRTLNPADDSAARDSVARSIARRARDAGVAVSTRLVRATRAGLPLQRRVLRALAADSATIVLATGSMLRSTSVPGLAAHEELRELVAAGLTPLQALRAATANPAIMLGAAGEFGIVAPGARADLLLLDANPLEDVSNTGRLAGVMVRGRWLPASELQRTRDEVEAALRRRRPW
jgi:imidazolonepropionase-like amidohydrolase